MSFLSRKPARPGSRDGDAGRDDEYDDYNLYAADRYQGEGDDAWSPGEYFSPEGIKGRWAGENPEGRSGGRGVRQDNAASGDAAAGYDSYQDGFDSPAQRPGGSPHRPGGTGQRGAPRGAPDPSRPDSPRRDAARGDSARGPARDDSPRADGYPAYGADEYASGAYDLPDGADEDRAERPRRRRRDREDRSDWTGILRLRRDRGEDIWPDDGISDEDYWASVAADRPLTEPGAPGSDDRAKGGAGRRAPAAARPAGPDPRPGPGDRDQRDGPREPDQRGSDQRGQDQRSSDQRGATGRLGPPPGLAGDYQPAGTTGGAATSGHGLAGDTTRPGTGATAARPGTGPYPTRSGTGPNATRPGTGPNATRPGTGASPTVGVTVSRPPTGPGGPRSGSAGGPGTGPHQAWPGQQTAGRTSGGLPQAPTRPSFQPTGGYPSAAATASRPAPDRGDWGDRTERIERVNASGYPDQRSSGRSQGSATGHNPVMGSAGAARPPVPTAPPLSSGPSQTSSKPAASGRGYVGDAGGGDTGFWQAAGGPEAGPRDSSARDTDRRDGSRASGRETGGSIWSVPPRDTASARGTDDDPLTSTAYSRSALGETDGRSYRVAARRSQAQAMLTDQTESFAAQYQQGQRQAGLTGDYPAASFPPAEQRTGEYRQYRGDAAAAAQEATVRYPAYGSPPGHQPQQGRSQSDLGQPTVSQPTLSQPGFGPGNGQPNGQSYPGQAGRGAGGNSRPGAGGNGLSGSGLPGSGAADTTQPANSLPVNGRPSGQYDSQPSRPSQQQRQQPPPRPSAQAQPAASPLSAPVPSSSPGAGGGAGAPSGSRPAGHGGPNPYDTGAGGSYPYPGGQAHPGRQAAATAPPNSADDRYYRAQAAAGYPADDTDQGRPEQARPDRGRHSYGPGPADGRQDRRERPY